ncbi:MAG TPA: carbohydrate ABC transporter permease [Ktedonobacteraceae bacterium]|nr:carbohydrate ABC transporter permease [Ktedonobacteraceae bacterium]
MAQATAPANTAIQPVTKEVRPTRRLEPAHIILYIFLAIFTVTSIGPLIFSFVSSFKTPAAILAFPPSLIPNPATLANYQEILSNSLFLRWILNALIYAVGATVLNTFFSAMAGYAIARLRFPGKEFIFTLTLAVMMIPLAVTLIPKFLVVDSLHLTNTYWALILPAMAQPFSVFLMVQFMKGLPKELEEAAMLDGANRWRTFLSVILPLVKPALTAAAIVSFQGAWNDFQWPLVVLGTQDMYTLPLGLFFFKSANYTQYNLLIAASMFNTIPILILFFIFQRYFIEGASAAAVKG